MPRFTQWWLYLLGLYALVAGCRKDVPLVIEEEPAMYWTWDVPSPDTVRLTPAGSGGGVSWCSPDEEGLERPLCLWVGWNRYDVDPGIGIDWRYIVTAKFHSQGWDDSVGTVVTSQYGRCDAPLVPGSTVSTADPVYFHSTLHDDRPSVNCIDVHPVRHIGFVRLRHGAKQAGYARVGSMVDATGARLYWIEKVCFSKVPWTGIRIQE